MKQPTSTPVRGPWSYIERNTRIMIGVALVATMRPVPLSSLWSAAKEFSARRLRSGASGVGRAGGRGHRPAWNLSGSGQPACFSRH